MNDKNRKCLQYRNDRLTGESVKHSVTVIDDLKGFFKNEEERRRWPGQKVIYEVDAYQPVSPGTQGGLFFGITKIQSGQIGDEYFMTRGHFHAISNRAEYYWCINGTGMLILMDRDRKARMEKMEPGSLHYIAADTAHRVANTGKDVLSFGACWPADAGHDYEEIEKNGFAARLVNVNGIPELRHTK